MEPISAACLWFVGEVAGAATVTGVAGGIIGNRSDWIFCKVANLFGNRLASALREPENHDLLNGVVAAYRESLAHVARVATAQATTIGEIEIAERMTAFAKQSTASAELVATELVSALNPLISNPKDGPAVQRREIVVQAAADHVIQAVEARCGPLTGRLRSLFRTRAENGDASWEDSYRLHISEAIKTEPRFEKILNAGNIAELVGRTLVLEELANGIATDVAGLRSDVTHVRSMLNRTEAAVQQMLGLVGQHTGVPLATLEAILSVMGDSATGDDAATIEQRLRQKAAEYCKLVDRLSPLSDLDPAVKQLKREAIEQLKLGNFMEADKKLAEAEACDLSSLQVIETLARSRRLSAAETRGQRGLAALLRANPEAYREAARHFAEADEIASIADTYVSIEWKIMQANALYQLGEEFGRNDALIDSIALYEDAKGSLSAKKQPKLWLMTVSNLGSALRMLGMRTGDWSLLEQAARVFQSIIKHSDWTSHPDDWVTTRVNLSATLIALGELDRSTHKINRAIKHCREVIRNDVKTAFPVQWALAQTNLGCALCILADKDNRSANLHGAVSALREASEMFAERKRTIEWANAQSALGKCLCSLGQLKSDRSLIDEAVHILEEVSIPQIRDRVPIQWADAQGGLANALAALADFDGDLEMLKRSVEAYGAALQELPRERTPLDWAMVQNNLGNALVKIHSRGGGEVYQEKAIEAFDRALEEISRETAPRDWATVQENLGDAATDCGTRLDNLELLERGVIAYMSALNVLTPKRFPDERLRVLVRLALSAGMLAEKAENFSHFGVALSSALEAKRLSEKLNNPSTTKFSTEIVVSLLHMAKANSDRGR